MPRALLITYEFPPAGGVGVQRVLKLAKYLPAAGWDVSVLTVADPPGALRDVTLLEELPNDLQVHRVWSAEPARVLQVLRRAVQYRRSGVATPEHQRPTGRTWPPFVVRGVQALFVPDEKRLWRGPAARRALEDVLHERCSAVISSGPPNTAHLVASDLAEMTGIPWIADFRDPWVGNYFFKPPTPLHGWLQARWERRVVQRADLVLTVSEAMAQELRARHRDLPVDRFITIPNGFDRDDMPRTRRATSRSAGLTVAYLGTFQGSITPNAFLAAADMAIRSGRIPPHGLVLRHIGGGMDLREAAAAARVPGIIRSEGYLPHRKALAIAGDADVLLLVLPSGREGRPILTGKLFEYLALGRPILALVPEGAAADLVRDAHAGIVVPPDDPQSIADALVTLHRAATQGVSLLSPDASVVARFDRRDQAARVADLLNSLTGRDEAQSRIRRRGARALTPKTHGASECARRDVLTDAAIVFVNTYRDEHLGGGEIHLLHLLKGAVQAGMAASVVAAPHSSLAEAAREAGAVVIEDDLKRFPPTAACRLAHHLRMASADIVLATSSYTSVLARCAGPWAGALVVEAVHTQPASTRAFRFGLRGWLSQSLRDIADAATRSRSDLMIAVSQALRVEYLGRGVDPGRIIVIHNAVDSAAIGAAALAGGNPATMEADSLNVGAIGRLEPVKGFDVLLDAVPAVIAVHPETRFFIAGDGPDRVRLSCRIAADPILTRTVKMTGFVEAVPAFIAGLDIYCLPSLSEGFNTTVLEAMALGVPVVATDVGGTCEAVLDGVTGKLAPARRPDLLAVALVELLDDERERMRLGAQARQLVEERFQVGGMVRATLDAWRRLLSREP